MKLQRGQQCAVQSQQAGKDEQSAAQTNIAV